MLYQGPAYTTSEAGIYLLHTTCLSYCYVGAATELGLAHAQDLVALACGTFTDESLQRFVSEYGVEALDFTVLFCCQPQALDQWKVLSERAYAKTTAEPLKRKAAYGSIGFQLRRTRVLFT